MLEQSEEAKVRHCITGEIALEVNAITQQIHRFIDTFAPLGIVVAVTVLALLNLYKWRHVDKPQAKLLAEQRCDPPELLHYPRVSVLVTAWNESTRIDAHIQAFLALRYRNKELVLCAGGSDTTLEQAQKYASDQVIILEQKPGEGKQKSLRRCFDISTGEIMFLTDADCVYDDIAFENVIAPIVNGKERATTGRSAPLPDQCDHPFVLSQWYVDNYTQRIHNSGLLDYVEGILGRNAAFTRDIIAQTGGFTRVAHTGTDYTLFRQLKELDVSIRYVPQSCVQTEFKENFQGYIRQQARWLRNIILHGRDFGETYATNRMIMYCIQSIVLLLWPLTLLVSFWGGLSIWILAMAYGIFARLRYIRFGEISLRQPMRPAVYRVSITHIFVDRVAYAIALLETLIPSRRWKW